MEIEFKEKGSFLFANGKAREQSEPYSQLKLCFTATDRAVLEGVLTDLLSRDDCFFVKYSKEPKAGMFIGRCFLNNDQAVGKAWRDFRSNDNLYCTVQDDNFIKQFRG